MAAPLHAAPSRDVTDVDHAPDTGTGPLPGPLTVPRPVPFIAPEPPSTAHADKLYVVTRADLSPGYQLAQTAHAVADWSAAHPDDAETWRSVSNSLVILTAPDEKTLTALAAKATERGIGHTVFREPDLLDELTSVAFTPGETTRKMLSNLPLAGRRMHPDPEAVLAREKRARELSFAMDDCEQTAGQSVLAHGRSVREHYRSLVDHLAGRADLGEAPNWRLPDWVGHYRAELLATAPDAWTMDRYLTVHDCGKPGVLEVDAQGRRHFPGHSAASERTYREVYAGTASEQVAQLIAHDMDLHLLKAVGVPEFCQNPNAVGHLLAGLAEITSNAAMFGGIDSTGYKMKAKQLNARGRAICKHLFGDPA